MPRKECTQAEYIDYQKSLVQKARKRMVDVFATLNHGQMQGLINDVANARNLIGFAKSGKMQFYFI